MCTARAILWALGAGLLLLPIAAPAADTDLARQAQAILEQHCARCHGPDSAGKGGMNYVLDSARLIARKQIIPGDAGRSKLFHRVHIGTMPPRRVKSRPTPGQIAILRRWIDRGAPTIETAHREQPFIADETVRQWIKRDLAGVTPRHRQYMRYLSLVALANAGASEARLATVRLAAAKLLNSLSWQPRIATPRKVDAQGLLLRMDLRDVGWTVGQWRRLQEAYDLAASEATSAYQTIRSETRSEVPVLHADWFIATASRPPLYYDLLDMPDSDRALERLLRVDVRRDYDEDRVVRAGFNGSGVSRNNRLIERHDAAFGAYWRSYDFSANTDRQNLFEHPLGPQTGQDGFEPGGGEIIFNLPNGLQGYMLVDGLGRRIDRASVEIVSDPDRPDRTVEAGLSCMSCHVQGMIPKHDQIRAHVRHSASVFPRDDRAIVEAQYGTEAVLDALFERDSRRYQKALAETDDSTARSDPVSAVARVYEGELDMATVAAELGLRPADFQKRLRHTPALERSLGALLIDGGTVHRDRFSSAFREILPQLSLLSSSANTLSANAASDRSVGHQSQVLCMTFSPDGKRILSGGDDNIVRLSDAATGRVLHSFTGHSESVLAVAFAPDGKRALSAGMDRTIRIWDLDSGQALACLRGHTDRISALAVSADGKRALSASWDGTVGLWDLVEPKLVRRFTGHRGAVSAVAFGRDPVAISAGYDGTVRLWNFRGKMFVRRLSASPKEIYCLTVSSDGRLLATGGNDHNVYLWDIRTGRLLHQLKGHDTAIVALAFRPGTRELLSGASCYRSTATAIRMWDFATGQERGPGVKETDLWSITFSSTGKRAVIASTGRALHIRDLPP